MVRKPAVAGQFYDGSRAGLTAQIKKSFLSDLGPGYLPGGARGGGKAVKGAIVPHAGYMFSGPAAAHVYARIAGSDIGTFIILGTNHTGMGMTSAMLEDFETPLGIAKNDTGLAGALIKNCGIREDNQVHLYEHSIEVQLPFLQFTFKDFQFVPIVIASPARIREIGTGILKTIRESKKKVCILASSDFTHYGASYGYAPFAGNLKENIERLDREAMSYIQDRKPDEFFRFVQETGATICGFLPIYVMLAAIPEYKATLLKYYTSADILGDYSQSVSYAAIVLE
ncbi:MAG: AmmeMemoRadiSam system protein B [archaeon]